MPIALPAHAEADKHMIAALHCCKGSSAALINAYPAVLLRSFEIANLGVSQERLENVLGPGGTASHKWHRKIENHLLGRLCSWLLLPECSGQSTGVRTGIGTEITARTDAQSVCRETPFMTQKPLCVCRRVLHTEGVTPSMSNTRRQTHSMIHTLSPTYKNIHAQQAHRPACPHCEAACKTHLAATCCPHAVRLALEVLGALKWHRSNHALQTRHTRAHQARRTT